MVAGVLARKKTLSGRTSVTLKVAASAQFELRVTVSVSLEVL